MGERAVPGGRVGAGRWAARVLAVGTALVGMLLAPAGPTGPAPAQAHPLGNFTVNHYDGLTLRPDGVEVLAILDAAEIPTLQQRATVDTDGDGAYSPGEAAAHATRVCAERVAATRVTVDGTALTLAVESAQAEFPVSDQGLPITRVTCRLAAPAALEGRATVEFADSYLTDRDGWREVTARGDGMRVLAADVPAESSSQQLRAYPEDLLADPLDQRTARIEVEPGAGGPAGPVAAVPPTGVGWLDEVLRAGERALSEVAGRPELTPTVTGLAVLLALVLGAAHAALPGHGKTVMAAYLAGRQGTRRDALAVGATVTVTHTAGVLVFGLLITLVATFSPVAAMRWLGVISGLLVAGVGVALLRTALRRRRELAALPVAERTGVLVGAAVGRGSGHGHGHSHGHSHGHGHGHGPGWSRASLVGMGVAGGLVPSPTALVVLLVAVQFGRTWLGVGLVLCYALGMAGTLTAAGLLLVSVRDRLARTERTRVWRERAARVLAVLPVATAVLVLVVGLGLAARALAG